MQSFNKGMLFWPLDGKNISGPPQQGKPRRIFTARFLQTSKPLSDSPYPNPRCKGAMEKIGHFTWATKVALTKFTKSKFAPVLGGVIRPWGAREGGDPKMKLK